MHRADLAENPLEQFLQWFEEAKGHKEVAFDAMTLATADSEGRPSARIVLYKGITEDGFVFYTNYQSRKSIELEENPYACLVFYWPGIYKQIRIEGKVERITREESDHYFETRAHESKIAAWISEQSQEIPDRKHLLTRYKKYEKRFDKEVRCPEFWGGYRLIPEHMEFWEGRDHRIHDRLCYLKENNQWKIIRLAP